MTKKNVRPHLSLLSDDQKQQVHQYALQILTMTGVRVDSADILTRLSPKVGRNGIQGNIVRLPSELVGLALQSAPSSFDIFNRLGQPAFTFGDEKMHFGVGVTALYYMDPLTDALEPFSRAHMGAMVRLAGSLPHYDVVSTVGIVQDVPVRVSDLYGSLEMIVNTTKPLIILVSDPEQFPFVLDLFQAVVGELGERPFIIPYFNPVTPLGIDAGTLGKMVGAIERGLPIIFSSYGMAGASSPITPAGTLSLLLAELLAGLTISQVIKPGAPVSLGTLPNFFDLKTMQSFYDPQSILLNLACAEMMEYYKLPHCGVSGSGTGWGMDLIAADTYWMSTLTSSLLHGGLAPFVGDTIGAKAFSPNSVVYVHEIIEQALRLSVGFQLDDESAVLAEIDKVGPGGNFLGSPATVRSFRTAYYTNQIFPRWTMEKWQTEGQPEAKELLRKHTQQLINSALAPEDHAEVMEKGERFILSMGR